MLLVAASPLLRSVLTGLLKPQSEVEISREATSVEEVLEAIRERDFDAILLVYDAAENFGLELIKQLRETRADLPIIVLNHLPSEHDALSILRMNISAYLEKSSTARDLREAVNKVLKGKRFITPSIAADLALRMSLRKVPGESGEDLSPRESQVLGLIVRGKRRAEIAMSLSLSPQTVSTYRSRILEKLGLESNAALIRYALETRVA